MNTQLAFQAHSPTSREAAESMTVPATPIRERVFDCIALWNRNGLAPTDEQIAENTDLNPSTARPRRVELLRAGRIRQTGTAKTRSGRKAVTWAVAERNH